MSAASNPSRIMDISARSVHSFLQEQECNPSKYRGSTPETSVSYLVNHGEHRHCRELAALVRFVADTNILKSSTEQLSQLSLLLTATEDPEDSDRGVPPRLYDSRTGRFVNASSIIDPASEKIIESLNIIVAGILGREGQNNATKLRENYDSHRDYPRIYKSWEKVLDLAIFSAKMDEQDIGKDNPKIRRPYLALT